MKFYTINKFSKIIGVTPSTLRHWDKTNFLKPHHTSSNGYRYYEESQINQITKQNKEDRLVIGYCRVSSAKQKDDLVRQIDNVKTYMFAKGYSFEIITDIGSGINYNKKGLNELITLVTQNKVDKVVVLYKDRLLRFGFELLQNIFLLYDTNIEVIDNTEKSEEMELIKELTEE